MFETQTHRNGNPRPEPRWRSLVEKTPEERMVDRHTRMLHELGNICMEFVRDVGDAMKDATPAELRATAPSVGPVLISAARAVRQTVALEAKLAERRIVRKEKAEAIKAEQKAEAEAEAQYHKRGKEIYRRTVIERAVEGLIAGRSDSENLLTDLYERLDEYERHFDFTKRPISETVGRICRTIGLSPDWPAMAHEPWAVAEAEENIPGSPFAAQKAASNDDETDASEDAEPDGGGSEHQQNGRDPPDG